MKLIQKGVALPPETWEKLQDEAHRRSSPRKRVTVADLIREAVAAWLARRDL